MDRLFGGSDAACVAYTSPRFRVDAATFRFNYKQELENWSTVHPDATVRPVEVLTRAAPVQSVFDDDDDSSSDDGDRDLGGGAVANASGEGRQSMWSKILTKHTTFAAGGGNASESEDIDDADSDDASDGAWPVLFGSNKVPVVLLCVPHCLRRRLWRCV